MSFILGGFIIIGAIGVAALMVLAAGMSDSPSASEGAGGEALTVLIVGVIVGVLVIGSHWIHLGW